MEKLGSQQPSKQTAQSKPPQKEPPPKDAEMSDATIVKPVIANLSTPSPNKAQISLEQAEHETIQEILQVFVFGVFWADDSAL